MGIWVAGNLDYLDWDAWSLDKPGQDSHGLAVERLDSVEGQGFDAALEQVSWKFHLISPGCSWPNSAFIVQKKSGLKHQQFISIS